eukprot:m.67513 g.67513  ORF g.67513 m.67513 type:complete len:216 (-) comp11895_c0_seq3:139-786(-)
MNSTELGSKEERAAGTALISHLLYAGHMYAQVAPRLSTHLLSTAINVHGYGNAEFTVPERLLQSLCPSCGAVLLPTTSQCRTIDGKKKSKSKTQTRESESEPNKDTLVIKKYGKPPKRGIRLKRVCQQCRTLHYFPAPKAQDPRKLATAAPTAHSTLVKGKKNPAKAAPAQLAVSVAGKKKAKKRRKKSSGPKTKIQTEETEKQGFQLTDFLKSL